MAAIENRLVKLETVFAASPDSVNLNAEAERWDSFIDRMRPLLGAEELASVTAFLDFYADPSFGLVHGPIFPPQNDYRRHLPELLLNWIQSKAPEERRAALADGEALGCLPIDWKPGDLRPNEWLRRELIHAAQNMDDRLAAASPACSLG